MRDADQLVTAVEIAERCGVQPKTILQWRKRHASFPQPAKVLISGTFTWRWGDVQTWHDAHLSAKRPAATGTNHAAS